MEDKKYFNKQEIYQFLEDVKRNDNDGIEQSSHLEDRSSIILYIKNVINKFFIFSPNYEELVYEGHHPIVIARDIMFIIHLFRRDNSSTNCGFSEPWLTDNDGYHAFTHSVLIDFAREIIDALEGYWTPISYTH